MTTQTLHHQYYLQYHAHQLLITMNVCALVSLTVTSTNVSQGNPILNPLHWLSSPQLQCWYQTLPTITITTNQPPQHYPASTFLDSSRSTHINVIHRSLCCLSHYILWSMDDSWNIDSESCRECIKQVKCRIKILTKGSESITDILQFIKDWA